MRLEAPPPALGCIRPQLDLCFTRSPNGATYLSRQRAGYPFHVGRLLTDEEGARVIVQSSSGGLFEDDDVHQHLAAAPGARARVETAAATIVHSMTGGQARARVSIEVHEGARLDWLPHPSILFPGARLASQIDVKLHPGARIMLTDCYTSHDPDGSERTFGSLDAAVSVRHAKGRLLARDRFVIDGTRDLPLGGVSRRFTAHGGLMVLTLDMTEAAAVAQALERVMQDAFYAGAGLLPNQCGAFARILASDSQSLRTTLESAIDAVQYVMPR